MEYALNNRLITIDGQSYKITGLGSTAVHGKILLVTNIAKNL